MASVDPKRQVALKPPDGALVVRVYNRQLARNLDGQLRYTVAKDYVAELNKIAPSRMWAARFAEVGIDWMWITRPEWQALMPAQPRQEQKVQVVPSVFISPPARIDDALTASSPGTMISDGGH